MVEDIVAKVTKLEPAPLAFPNGGGLSAMSKGSSKRQKLERELLELQHKVNLAKLGERHLRENKPERPKTVKPANKTGSTRK